MNLTVGQLSGSDATKTLQNTVIELSKSSEKQTKHIIQLTYAMLFLTFVMASMVGVQIYIVLQQNKSHETMPISSSSSVSNHKQQPIKAIIKPAKQTKPAKQVENINIK